MMKMDNIQIEIFYDRLVANTLINNVKILSESLITYQKEITL